MSGENIERHSSYHNRFRTSSSEYPTHKDCRNDTIPSISESVPVSPHRKWSDAGTRRLQFAGIGRPSHSDRPLWTSVESCPDDVFVDMSDTNDTTPAVTRPPLRSTFSNTSTITILPNPHNRVNHRIHSMVWCSCCLYFVFICCLPAVHYMQESDKEFQAGEEQKAKRLGMMSTYMFAAGTIIALACYAAVLFLVIFFTAYNK